MRRSHLVYISVTLADSLSKCPVVQLLQSMFDTSALCANTSTQTVSACIDSSVDNVLHQINPDFNQSRLEFIHILERRLIDPLWHDPPELVIDEIEVRAVGRPQIRRKNLGICAPTVRSFCAPMSWCTVPLKHERVSPATRLIARSTIVSK